MNEPESHIRHGFSTVRPYLHGPIEPIDFARRTFGAVERERHVFSPDGVHVELRLDDSIVVIESGALPSGVAPWMGSVYAYVADADAVHRRALQLGAAPLAAPEDEPCRERQAGFVDSGGDT